MYTFYNEEEDHTIYVLSGKDYFDELVQDAIDFGTGFWKPDENLFYTVNGQLIEVLDSQPTIEKAIKYAKEFDGGNYRLESITRKIIFGDATDIRFHDLVEKYWGGHAFAVEIEEATNEEEGLETYAIYNDSIDNEVQLGTLTLKRNDKMTAYKVYKDIIS